MKLTIRFAGICTHFLNGVAAGVPHRVVLPTAAKINVGLLSITDVPSGLVPDVNYYLLPHFAQLETVDGTGLIDVEGLIDGGDIIAGTRLQVRNAADRELLYDQFDAPRLKVFDPDYTISSDVVLGGRATCYFDLYAGRVTSTIVNDASQTIVELETDGVPELLVTPLARANTPVQPRVVPLPIEPTATEATLYVKNLEPAGELESNQSRGAFDFLWHYLTASGGIPPGIERMVPGMNIRNYRSATPQEMADALRELASLLAPPKVHPRALIHVLDVTPSCSDSQYP
jgi:hypothetical protein